MRCRRILLRSTEMPRVSLSRREASLATMDFSSDDLFLFFAATKKSRWIKLQRRVICRVKVQSGGNASSGVSTTWMALTDDGSCVSNSCKGCGGADGCLLGT